MYCTLSLLVLSVALAAAHPSSNVKVISRRSPSVRNGRRLGIYDGHKTTIEKHAYEVSLLNSGSLYCAATIVSESWVVTSGDCTYQVSPSDFTVVAGATDGYKGTSYKVHKIVQHPKYGQADLDYDYACIQIKGKFKWSSKVKHINLGKGNPKDNANMLTAGWGDTSELVKNAPNTQMLQGYMEWTNETFCKTTCEGVGITWTPRMACAYNPGKTTLCNGDWSDPFVHNHAYYGLFAAGISNGFCSSYAQPNILANVANQAAWIKKTTGAKYQGEDDDDFGNDLGLE